MYERLIIEAKRAVNQKNSIAYHTERNPTRSFSPQRDLCVKQNDSRFRVCALEIRTLEGFSFSLSCHLYRSRTSARSFLKNLLKCRGFSATGDRGKHVSWHCWGFTSEAHLSSGMMQKEKEITKTRWPVRNCVSAEERRSVMRNAACTDLHIQSEYVVFF